METTAPASAPLPTRPRRHLFWKILAGAALVWVIAVAMLALELVTLSRQAGLLRQEVLAALDVPAHRQVQLSIGPGTLSAARTALDFIPDVPAEAREALRAVRGASVGVYRLDHAVSAAARTRMLAAADHAMVGRGWTRVVGVTNAHETVVLYSPAEGRDAASQVCLAVCQDGQLVIAEGRIDAEQLVKLTARFQPQFASR